MTESVRAQGTAGARRESEQARVLRRGFVYGALKMGAVFTAVFVAAALILELFFIDGFANAIADKTSSWVVYTWEGYSAAVEDGVIPEQAQTIVSQDGSTVSVRDLTVYNALKSLKVPVVVIVYLAGLMVVLTVQVNRMLRCFSEVVGAVGALLSDRSQPVALSPELALTQGELNAIREASLADERAAVAAERRKNELVAYLAHDIKTPLTSVVGYLGLLDEARDLPAETRERYVSRALGKAERLETLIDEFFEITRYNVQSIPIERQTVDVALFCEQVADEFFPEAASRGIEIDVSAPADERFFVDPGKLARALGNVVRNAVAYAEPGSAVTLEAWFSASAGAWMLRVRNRGREISAVHLQSIFDKFYREDSARATDSGGAGLGLAIAKEIVAAHGGVIEAESDAGVTTFTVRIPQ